MKVLYTCDNNYIWIMGISMISLFENNKHINDLKVYLLGEKISDDNKKILKDIGDKYSRCIEVIDIPELDIPPSLVSARWPISAFTRLFSGIILPHEIDKILYLDCDTIVLGDIEQLNYVDFKDNIVMGVKDCISGIYKRNIGLDSNSTYINAGVLVLNLDALRKVDIKHEIESYMRKYMKLINYADQDILNGIFKGRIGELNPKYDIMTIDVVHTYEEIMKLRKPTNFYDKIELSKAIENPSIIHYTTNMLVVRPWFKNTDHPLAYEFEKYMNMSPWKDKEFVVASFGSKEAKVISVINKFPKSISYWLLGFIHSELRPRYIKMRAR